MGLGGSYQLGKEQITKFLKTKISDGASILDVGAGCGTYQYFLGDNYNFEAVEIWQESVEVLKQSYNKVYAIDIRNFKYEKDYDLIIFGDVLEHLSVVDAKAVLDEAEKHTNKIMIAVPYKYEQDALYGNEAEIHIQDDLTPELFDERYPGYTYICGDNAIYGYYFKDKSYNKAKICTYAICKNESKFVETWMNDFWSADYICVLDTGSTDNTYEKLLKYQELYPGKVIVKQQIISPWRFDVARNESMNLIPEDADILFCTDFDERINTGWADWLKCNWKLGHHNRGFYKYAWSHSDEGAPRDIFTQDKIHTREHHWIFPVHEVLWPIADIKDYKEVELQCDGIFMEHFQDKTKSRKAYFDLLQLAVEENPDNPHETMLLAREYLLNNDLENAIKYYKQTLDNPVVDNPEFKLVLLESLGRCASCYAELKNYDEAIWYCQEFIKEDPTYREPYFIMGELYNNMRMYTLAEAVIKAGFEYSTRKYDWIERRTTWNGWGEAVLSNIYTNLGRYKEALEQVNKVLEEEPNNIEVLKNKIALLEAIQNKK